MARPARTKTPPSEQPVPAELARDSIGYWRSLAQPVSVQAPAGGIALIPATMAAIVGRAGPLSFLLGIVSGLFLVFIFVQMSRRIASAGATYAYVGVMLGSAVAFVVAWIYMFAQLTISAGLISQSADFFGYGLRSSLHIGVAWALLAALLWIVAMYLLSRRISVSTAVLFGCEGISILLVIAVGVVVLARGGAHGDAFSLSYFDPKGISPSSIALGVSTAFLGFGGFESAAMLSEEAKDPRVTVPKTMLVALVGSGLLYTFGSWFESAGFPSPAALAGSPTPLFTVAATYVDPAMAVVLAFACTISAFSSVVGCANAGSRVLFALFRDGFISRRLAATHRSEHSPIRVIYIWSAITLVLSVGFAWTSPASAFDYVAGVGSYLVTAVYLVFSAGSVVFFGRQRRPWHALIAVISAGILGYALYSSLVPAPSFPYDVLPYIAFGLLIAGVVIIAASPRLRRTLSSSPHLQAAAADAMIQQPERLAR